MEERNLKSNHFWVTTCLESLTVWQLVWHMCLAVWTWERGKVVLLTLRLLLNIKTGGIKFSASSLILDSMHLRSAGPLRPPPPWNYTCDSNAIKKALLLFFFYFLLKGQLMFEVFVWYESQFKKNKVILVLIYFLSYYCSDYTHTSQEPSTQLNACCLVNSIIRGA